MSHAIILEEHPGEGVPDLKPCPQCRITTPMIIIARATSERQRVYHYHLCGCQHAHDLGDWSFPPHGMSTSRMALANAWNKHVEEFKP